MNKIILPAYKAKNNYYLCAKEIAELVNDITEEYIISPHMVNIQLCDSGVLRHLESGEYEHTYSASNYCSKVNKITYSFYTWEAKFALEHFGINLNKKINNRTIKKFCLILKKYSPKKLNKRIIKHRLQCLQSYLSNSILQEINNNCYFKKDKND